MSADPTLDSILGNLESDSDATRMGAVLEAVQLGERSLRAIPTLQRMAEEERNPQVRHQARKALHLLALEAYMTSQGRAPAVTPPLAPPSAPPAGKSIKSAKITQALAKESLPVVASKLNSKSPDVRASALRATAIKRERLLLPALLERLGIEPEPELRALQARVLAILGGMEQLKNVAGFLDDPDAGCRAVAVDVLAQFRHVMAFPFIIRALQDPDPRPQQRAAAELKKIGPTNVLNICEVMVQSERTWSREAAVHCLVVASVPGAAPILESCLKDKEAVVRDRARLGLDRLGKTATPGPARLDEDLASADVASRRAAAKRVVALEGALDESHLPALTERLGVETDVEVLVSLLTALGRIGSAEPLPALTRTIAHDHDAVRAASVDALGAIGTPAALAAIHARLRDPSAVVQGRALVALRDRPEIDLRAEVTRMAEHPDRAFRETAAYVITELGDESLAPLVEKLSIDPDPVVADVAGVSTELLAEDLQRKLQQRRASRAVAPVVAPVVPPAPPPGKPRWALLAGVACLLGILWLLFAAY